MAGVNLLEHTADIGILATGDTQGEALAWDSFLAVEAPGAMELSFRTTCHGTGRAESRTGAKKLLQGRDIRQELDDRGIIGMAHSWASLAEEASIAYKDVADVVEAAKGAELCHKVARLTPLGVIKG